MDVDSLRNELEEHLKRNPDEHAPSGFRDRFAATLEDIEGAADEESKTELEAELQQIRAEAEAAANCAECGDDPEADDAGSHDHGAAAPVAQTPVAEAPVAEAKVEEPATTAAPAEAANDPVGAPESGLMQRYGLILAAILVALVVAIYFYR